VQIADADTPTGTDTDR